MTEVQSGPTDGSTNSSTASSPIPSAPNAPKYGTMIPNRIFVGGISFNGTKKEKMVLKMRNLWMKKMREKMNKKMWLKMKQKMKRRRDKTCEAELKNYFSHYGRVKETKIIADRAGVSKGYAFITFETQEEAVRILKEQANNLVFKDKKLNIGQAIRKQPMSLPKNVDPALIPSGMVLTSPLGYSYTYHNGVAYFNPAEVQGPPPPPSHAQAGHHPPATAVIPHHHHAQHHSVSPSMAYPQYTVPVMLQAPPPTSHSHPQYLPVSSQPQQGQYYQQPISTTPQWTTIPGQWRWVHPQQQAAGGLTGGVMSPLYATAPGTDLAMYPAATPAYAQTPGDVQEMPIMEPSQNEPHHQMGHAPPPAPPQPGPAPAQMPVMAPPRPYLQPPPPPPAVPPHHLHPHPHLHPELAAYPAELGAALPHLLPKMPLLPSSGGGKLAPKRSIKMPRRDRAPKMVRSAADGLHYTLARMDDHPGLLTVNGYPTSMAQDN